ncbi:MAG: sugar phosphate isomerase/epimerase family protein [Phocaeicola sp.]|uniref:sugar phosphate isomerase/epimerase family protein n=1 Tax=Phocaeicola sp. TaxID=2773926 RepID=UPI003F9F053B
MVNRRTFLKGMSALAMSGLAVKADAAKHFFSADSIHAVKDQKHIGLQTYSLAGKLEKDLSTGMDRIAKMGYTELEICGYRGDTGDFGGFTAQEYRTAAENAGLKITGSHLNPPVRKYTRENLSQISDFWKKAVEMHHELGVRNMVQPGLPQIETEDDAKLVAEVYNNAGEISNAAGILWGYHNHSGEFRKVANAGVDAQKEGKYIEEIFLKNTDPEKVIFELDCYWAVMGQQDPCEWLEDYSGRYKLLHIKDRWILGDSGMMNFEKIFNVAYKNGLIGFYVELERDRRFNRDQWDGVEASAKYLLSKDFVK